jgi:hypothetical protein
LLDPNTLSWRPPCTEPPYHLPANFAWIHLEAGEDPGRRSLILFHQREQDVFCAYEVVAYLQRLSERLFQDFLRLWSKYISRFILLWRLAVADDGLNLLSHILQAHVE